MVDLSHLSADELRAELDGVDSKAPTLRLVVGINHTLICSSEYFLVSGVRSWSQNGQQGKRQRGLSA